MMKVGFTGISSLASGMGALFGAATDKVSKEKTKSAAVNLFDIESEIVIDPFFKKAQGLKKILIKYSNKTFSMNEDHL